MIHTIKNFYNRLFLSKKVFLKDLMRLKEILDRSELQGRYWLVGGMVLGYAREHDMLSHDFDADIAIWEEDREKLLDVLPQFFKVGFKKQFRWVNNEGVITEYCLQRHGMKFEFFINFKGNDGKKCYWYAYQRRKNMQYLREMDILGLQEVEFLGSKWLIPDDLEYYLTQSYGTWRIPNKDFDYTSEKSVPCSKSKTDWKGTCHWD